MCCRPLFTRVLLCLMLLVTGIGYAHSAPSSGCPVAMDHIKQFYEKVQCALRHNPSEMATFVQFPLRINARQGHVVRGQRALEALMPQLRQTTAFKRLRTQPFKSADVICRGAQVGLASGVLWTQLAHGTLKAFVINVNEAVLKPAGFLGQAILPVRDTHTLARFVQQQPGYRLSSAGHLVAANDQTMGLRLYHADINNDGAKEWVVVNTCGGSLCTSQIKAIYRANFKPFDDNAALKIFQQYLYVSNPFLIHYKKHVYIRFDTHHPEGVCRYLWKHHAVHLVAGRSCSG